MIYFWLITRGCFLERLATYLESIAGVSLEKVLQNCKSERVLFCIRVLKKTICMMSLYCELFPLYHDKAIVLATNIY